MTTRTSVARVRDSVAHHWQLPGPMTENRLSKSFFYRLKRDRIRRRTYKTREQARQDIFGHIEMFYNATRKHARNQMLSPVDLKNRQRNMNQEDF